MWNVVFVMGLESLGMTARGMELGQPACAFFSPVYLVAMALSSYGLQTEDEKCACSNMCVIAHVSLCFSMTPTS